MKREDLKVGMWIKANEETKDDVGQITDIIGQAIYIHWNLGRDAHWHSICRKDETINYWVEHRILTKEEKVMNRIHKLWNESKWVQANPSRAY